MNKKDQGKLRVAIIGAGGIGGYYGARLVIAGHQVDFVARGDHLAVLRKDGLTIDHPRFQFQQAVDACDLNELIENNQPVDFDALLVCIKATATVQIAEKLQAWFQHHDQKTAVLSLQNGVENEPVLAGALGLDSVLGGLAVRIGAEVAKPGVIAATGIAQLIVGVYPNESEAVQGVATESIPKIVAELREAGVEVQQSEDIRRELWRKLVINNGVNPLSAVVGLDTRTITRDQHLAPIVKGLMQEAASAARHDHVRLTDNDVAEMFQLIYDFDAIKTSMLIDREKGRPLEIDGISGVVMRNNEAQSLESPFTHTVSVLLGFTVPNKAGQDVSMQTRDD
jgi:2-dehydropantoate 2-reductase